MSRSLRRLALVALFTAPLLAACGGEDAEETGTQERAVTVTTIEAETQPVEIVESAIGSIESTASPVISAEVAARVVRLYVDAGDSVSEGDLLAELDSEDFEIDRDRAEAEIARLEARIENQGRDVERERRLYEQGHTPEATLQDSQTELQALQQELASARSDLRSAERNINRTRILAPYHGTVDERHVAESDFVQTGEPIFTLSTDARLRVEVPFPETVGERLEPGKEVRLTTPLAPGNGITADISDLRPSVSSDSRAVRAIIYIDNPGGWRPGASVNAELVVERRESVLLPSQAVVRRPDGEVVYLLDEDRAVQQTVDIGKRTRDEIEILSGVSAGDRVIVDGASFLTDGALVRLNEQESDEQGADGGNNGESEG